MSHVPIPTEHLEPPPSAPTTNERILREERREARRQRKEQERQEAARKAAEKLEKTARRMYIVGFFALPLVWLVGLLYFHKEHKQAEGSQAIKKCK